MKKSRFHCDTSVMISLFGSGVGFAVAGSAVGCAVGGAVVADSESRAVGGGVGFGATVCRGVRLGRGDGITVMPLLLDCTMCARIISVMALSSRPFIDLPNAVRLSTVSASMPCVSATNTACCLPACSMLLMYAFLVSADIPELPGGCVGSGGSGVGSAVVNG